MVVTTPESEGVALPEAAREEDLTRRGTRFAELFREVGGFEFSSLNCSISSSMPMSFHSSSGGGRMLPFVLVCSLKRDARGCVDSSTSSLMA
jgi:hypothetical protein